MQVAVQLVALEPDAFRSFDAKTKAIAQLDKDGNPVARQLTMPAEFIQLVHSSLKRDMASLAVKRRNGTKGNGRLKFRSSYVGMEQIPSSAKLVKRPSGICLLLTCFTTRHEADNGPEKKPVIGIETMITTSEGEEFDISIRES